MEQSPKEPLLNLFALCDEESSCSLVIRVSV